MTRWLPRVRASLWTGSWRDRDAQGVQFSIWWGPAFAAFTVALRRSA